MLIEWVLDRDDAERAHGPAAEDVEDAISALDGAMCTLVTLSSGTRDCLMIGGGNEGRCLVNYLVDVDTQENYVLVDPALSGEEMDLVIAGQWSGPYPRWACVGKPLALEAAWAFVETGRFPSHLVCTELSDSREPQASIRRVEYNCLPLRELHRPTARS